ncbi:EamA family transporter RarD [uncultured Thiothrix sp.]|uniref:EamA family transporter RarD n=1 Tax=uncultured Thiothrix sp. TaxID=223185 RepID=UPI002623F45A|nr:EamA family transporter RarD [uncultured Thiothrix sp.]HMT95004.1 EamA family transporter RarD [Thiolinea sp.]
MLSQQKLGLIYGLSAYTIWGLFPWYFHFLSHVNPWQVLTQRIIWSFLLVSVIALFIRHWSLIKAALMQRNILLGLLLSSLLIAANWLIFIWAVGQGRVLESSLGYFITPLVSVLLARIFLKESLDIYRLSACILAVIGVLWLVIQLGVLPWISLSLAISFGFYGLVRKKVPVDSLTGLWVETGILLPFAFTWWLWLEWQGQSQLFTENLQTTFLLIFSGALTAAPLLLFASAANRLSLTAVGFMMYINPTMQFLTAIYLLKEPLNHQQLIAFICIWIALVVFSIGAVRQQNAKNQALATKASRV